MTISPAAGAPAHRGSESAELGGGNGHGCSANKRRRSWSISSDIGRALPAKLLLLLLRALLVMSEFTRIVAGIQVFEAQRTNGRYLGDVLTGFCPVEVGRVSGQNDDATGRIRFHLIAVELIAQADVENARHDCVDPVLRVPVWHQLHAGGHFDTDHVGARL